MKTDPQKNECMSVLFHFETGRSLFFAEKELFADHPLYGFKEPGGR